MHGDLLTVPMRSELTRLGLRELRTPDEVDTFIEESREGSALIAVNSTCGCAAGSMRPGLAMALRASVPPALLATVFAGQDREATERAREYFLPHPPSSPAVALFRNGEIVHMLPRERIQGRPPEQIAVDLVAAFKEHWVERVDE